MCIVRLRLLVSLFITVVVAFSLQTIPAVGQPYAGQGTPLLAQLGTPVQIDPTEGLRAASGENLRAEWSWESRPPGSTAEFDDNEAYRPVFTPDESGTYVALATFYEVQDIGSTTPRHFVRVEIGTGNLTPIARIRTRGFPTGSTPIQFDGSASYDVNGDALTYQWTIESGPAGHVSAFADPTAPVTNLRLDVDGDYTVGLTVEDASNATSEMALFSFKFHATFGGTTDVFHHFFDQNYVSQPLISNLFDLGDLSADLPQDMAVLGFRMAAGGELFPDTIEFEFNNTAWSLSSPQSIMALVDALVANSNTRVLISPDSAFNDITFIFGGWLQGRGTLTIKDLLGPELPRQDVIDAGAGFYEGSGGHHVPPVPSTRFEQLPAQVNQPVYVDPYATTIMDGKTLNYNWSLTVAPQGSSANLGWPSDALTSLTPPAAGDYVITLRSWDWAWTSADPILVSAGPNTDLRPVAVISPVASAPVETVLPLDGTQSFDLDGDLLNWSWALLSRPDGSTAALTDTSAPIAHIEPDLSGLYVVQLQVAGGGKTSVPATLPILVDTPLPVANAGLDQIPDFQGDAVVNSSASAPNITQQMWRSLQIGDSAHLSTIDDPQAVQTEVTVGRRSTPLHEAVKDWPVYNFSGRAADPGYCDYDTRLPSNVPEADPAEPVTISLASLGQVWGPMGLSQVWAIENLGEYTRSLTLIDENSTIYGTYTLPGEVTLYVTTPDTDARSLTVEVGGTPEATAWGLSSPYSNWSIFACTVPGSNVFQVSVANVLPDGRTGFALPDTVFVGDTNIRPVVNRPADLSADLASPVTLTGTDYSYDANGGGLAYSWALIHRPTGSSATLDGTPINSIHTGPMAEFTPDQAGLYLVQLVAADTDFISEPAVIAVMAGGDTPNRPPVLEPLDPLYTFEAGLIFNLTLIGSDPDGDPITFFINPLPLPAGFTFDAKTGVIRFAPDIPQIGTYVFTVGVSDGALTDQATLTIEVEEPSAIDTAITGIVRDAETLAPLSGIPVRLRDADITVTTNGSGMFEFDGLAAGTDQVIVEPSAAGGPGGYLGAVRQVRIIEDQIRPLDPDFLLTPLGQGCVTVASGSPTVITGSTNGVTVTIPADSIQVNGGGAYTGDVCLGSLPELFQPEGMPQDTNACRIYALEAPGAVFSQGISVVAPNVDGLPETTALDFWQANPLNGLIRPAANAGVDTGAATVSTNAPLFRQSTLFTFLPRAPTVVASADQPVGNRQYSFFDGNMQETYRLPGYRAFDRVQRVGFTYNSETASPHVILAGDVTIGATTSLPVDLTTRINVGGMSLSDDAAWNPHHGLDGSNPPLVGQALTMRQSLPVDAIGLDSGRYSYDFVAKAHYACSTVSATHRAHFNVHNQTESPFGPGWSVEGLQELVVDDEGHATIFDDTGISTFDPQPTLTEFEDEPLVFPAYGPQRIVAVDYDLDGNIDVAYGEGTGNITLLRNLGDRNIQPDQSIAVGSAVTVPPTGVYTPNLLGTFAGELSNDNAPDIAYGLQIDRNWGYIQNDGFGGFTNVALAPGGQPSDATRDLVVVDLDGDGYQDIVYVTQVAPLILQSTEVWVSYGGPTSRTLVRIANIISPTAPLQLIVADIDGNGRMDVAYRKSSGVDFLFQTGYRTFVSQQSAIGSGGLNLLAQYFQMADFNGNGKLDIIWSGEDNLTVFLNANTTGRTFLPGVALARPPSATTAMSVHVADANGDGIDDIIASVSGELAVYLGNGDGTFQPFESGFVNYSAGHLTFVDIDGDGSLDLLSTQRFTVRVHFSKPSASGSFRPGNGEFSELIRLEDGTFERRYPSGNVVVFDENGRQTAEIDAQGNRREFAYDQDGRLATITDQAGGETTFTYGLIGRLASVTYPDGRVTEFTYGDEDRLLVEIEDPEGTTVGFAYDDYGRLVSTTNQNGYTTGYSYDATGRLNGAHLPDGSSIRMQIAASMGLVDVFGSAAVPPYQFVRPEDRVTVAVDRKGGETEIVVNAFGSVVQTTDPIGRLTVLERDANDLVIAVERPNEALPGGTRRDEMTYDGRGNITSRSDAVGTSLARTTLWEYDPDFNGVTSITEPGGFETEFEYDATGLLLRREDAEGGQRLYAYNSDGLMISRIDENGNETEFDYDANGNLIEITYADGSVTELTRDNRGFATVTIEAAGTAIERQILRTFDNLGRLVAVAIAGSDGIPISDSWTREYDGAGNLISMIDETGFEITAVYDALNRLIALEDPASGQKEWTINLAGEVVEHTTGAGEIYTYEYDAISRLIQATDPDDFDRSLTYDLRDNVVSVSDAMGGTTSYQYDGLNRQISRTNALNLTQHRTFDARDNLLSVTREDSSVETASYDGLSRLIELATATNTLAFEYDARGNLTEAANNDSRVTFSYGARNRLADVITDGTVGPQPEVTLAYNYDLLGRRISMTDSLGGSTAYTWDLQDQIETLTSPWSTVYSFTYDDAGRRTGLTSSSGQATTMAYTNGLLTALTHVHGTTTLADLTYQYRVDGQLQAEENILDPIGSQSFAYDALNRLLEVEEGVPASQVPVETFTYDGEGNRLSSWQSSIYVSNAGNQLTEDDDYVYAYDDRGNRISRTAKVGSAVETYVYDEQNRLIGFVGPATTASYTYDALGRRIARTIGSTTEAFVYDTWSNGGGVRSNRALEFEDGVLARRWQYEPENLGPLAFEEYSGTTTPGSGSLFRLLANRLGSIITAISISTGAVAADYDYTSFGDRSETGTNSQPFGFIGQEHDSESGLIHLGARAYDPVTGRFMQTDPIGFSGGDLNLYSYSFNDPVNRLDPTGLTSTVEQQRLAAANTAMAVGAVEAISGGIASLIERMFAAMQGALLPDVVYSGPGSDSSRDGSRPEVEVEADAGGCDPLDPDCYPQNCSSGQQSETGQPTDHFNERYSERALGIDWREIIERGSRYIDTAYGTTVYVYGGYQVSVLPDGRPNSIQRQRENSTRNRVNSGRYQPC